MDSLKTNQRTINVVMFPWLAHGHISPYLELAKKLSKRNFIIHLCSTNANLSSIRSKLGKKFALSIRIVELHLPTTPELPPCYHTTNGLPPHLMPLLKTALDNSESNFTKIMESIKPDLLIYDFLQPWAPLVASRLGIPAVEYITGSSTMHAYMIHFFKKPQVDYPFESIHYRDYELVHRDRLLSVDESVKRNGLKGIARSSRIVLIKGFKEIEARYIDYLSALLGKKIVPVGPLVQDPNHEANGSEIIEWLDKKGKNSTVFVSFGSEYFLEQKHLEELAHGLELSNVNFIWVVRFPKGATTPLEDALPHGFLQRVGDRGLVLEGWAPQAKILGHASIGGFVSHCGCSSLMESMKFGVPIIAMPWHIDQPLNARLVEEIGVGMEVVRGSDGVLQREEVSAVIRRVVFEEEGETVRENARKMSMKIMEKGDQEIDEVVEELVKVLDTNKVKNGVRGFRLGHWF